jgi:endonuclease YncB( thermonuclease family)
VYAPTHGLRLLGVNTPELLDRDPAVRAEAQKATRFTAQWLVEHAAHLAGDLSTGWPFAIHTVKTDSFDRPLTTLECGQGHDLTVALLLAGYPPYARKKVADEHPSRLAP